MAPGGINLRLQVRNDFNREQLQKPSSNHCLSSVFSNLPSSLLLRSLSCCLLTALLAAVLLLLGTTGPIKDVGLSGSFKSNPNVPSIANMLPSRAALCGQEAPPSSTSELAAEAAAAASAAAAAASAAADGSTAGSKLLSAHSTDSADSSDSSDVWHQLRVARFEMKRLNLEAKQYLQVASESIPKPLQCLTVSLTLLSQQLQPDAQSRLDTWQQSPALSDSSLLHVCIFSDNVVAVAVAVNSTVVNSPLSSRLVFHIVTDGNTLQAMRAWFALNPPGDAVMEIQSMDSLGWFNASYVPALRQMQTKEFRKFYSEQGQGKSDPVEIHDPKYISPLNHIRFYLPQLYPNLRRILFLDDDVVVQRDLSPLFSLDLEGNVIGAVETCGKIFHRFHRYLNFSDPRIRDHFDPEACGWAFGVNLFDLDSWRKANITETYHFWQEQNMDHSLWQLGTLPPGLLAFYGHLKPIDKSWHVLGLGYQPDVDLHFIESAAAIHFNGNRKPWTKLGFPHFRSFWAKYLHTSSPILQKCRVT